MAKMNGNTKIIGLIITLAVIFASIVGTWTVYGEHIDKNACEIEELEKDGCDPAQKHTTEIAVVKRDMSSIKEDVSEIRREQKQGFERILERLDK